MILRFKKVQPANQRHHGSLFFAIVFYLTQAIHLSNASAVPLTGNDTLYLKSQRFFKEQKKIEFTFSTSFKNRTQMLQLQRTELGSSEMSIQRTNQNPRFILWRQESNLWQSRRC